MKSLILDRIRKKTSLQTRIFVHLQFEDIDNWVNGVYVGKITKNCKEVTRILDIVKDWQKDNKLIYDIINSYEV